MLFRRLSCYLVSVVCYASLFRINQCDAISKVVFLLSQFSVFDMLA